MKIDFDKVIDRSENNAVKNLEAVLHFGTNDVIPMWIADMDFKTAPEIIDAIQQRAQQGIFGYTNRPQEYFKACADWQKKHNGRDVDVSLMAFAIGVVPALIALVKQLSDEGDKILIQQPVYHPFEDVAVDFNRQLVVNELVRDDDNFYTIDFDDFEKKASDGVKIFILCNPHNPVGRVWTADELKKMGDICVRNNITIISDEIHSDLILFNNLFTPMASISTQISDKTITCIAPSKTFNLAGLQSSTIIFPNKDMLDVYVKDIKRNDIARNNCFSLVATMAAYTHGEEWLTQLITYLEGNMKYLKEYIDENIPLVKAYIPQATYLAWLDFSALNMSDKELKEFLVKKAGVALNAGESFGAGGSGFARMNIACPRATVKRALQQISKAVAEIKG